MHDIIWRYIKVTNKSQNLEYIQSVEKLYMSNPESMKSLVEKEELLPKSIEGSKQSHKNKRTE
jgi:hypothetical protein